MFASTGYVLCIKLPVLRSLCARKVQNFKASLERCSLNSCSASCHMKSKMSGPSGLLQPKIEAEMRQPKARAGMCLSYVSPRRRAML